MPTSARWEVANSPKIPVKYGASCRVDVGIDPYEACTHGVRSFELLHISREKSRKTEAVFLVGSRESEGKSKSPQALFLLPAFSFGEAKENAGLQSQICRSVSAFQQSFKFAALHIPSIIPLRSKTKRHCFFFAGLLQYL